MVKLYFSSLNLQKFSNQVLEFDFIIRLIKPLNLYKFLI